MGALIRPVIVIVLIATLLVVIPPSTALSDENGSESLPSVVLIEQAYRNGKIDYDTAIQYKVSSIFDPQALPAEYQSTTPAKCATPILLEVNANWETLKRETRDNLSAYPVGRPGSALLRPGLSGEVTYSTTHFQIHYTTSGTDAVPTTDVSPSNGIPDYIDNMGTELENVWTKELSNMGWLQPPSDVSEDGNSDYDVYVLNMFAYGYTQADGYADQGTATGDNENSAGVTEVNAAYGHIAMENDYLGFPNTPLYNIQVTAAHEFNHAIQFGYDVWEEHWLMEATATWMEDEVYDSVNDNLQYLTSYFNNPDVAMSNEDPGLHWYADWIFPRYISEHHGGQSTIRSIWENSVSYDSWYGYYSFSAVQDALISAATSLAAVFNNFTVANYVMSTSPTNNPYCYEEASSYPSIYIEGNINFSGSTVNYNPSDGIGNYAADYITISSTTDQIEIAVSGASASINYAARVIGMQSGVPTVTDIPLSGSPDSGWISLSTASYDTVILIVLNETPDSSSLTMSNYSVQVRVGDVTPPTMEAIVEAEGAYYNTAPVLSNFGFDDETALDDGWYQMGDYTGSWITLFTNVSGTSWDNDSWAVPGFGALNEGSHTIYFAASDDRANFEGESGEWSWQFYKDTIVPTDPTSVNSTSHTVSTWSSDNTVDIGWIDAIDSASGLDGYSVLWDTSAATIPDQTKDIEEGVQSASSTELADGNSNYFHITSVDNAGNWQSTVHVGPFFIDANPPADPTSVNSTSHTVSTWSSDNTVDIGWIDAIDSGSGLDGYSVLWDAFAATVPDQTKDIEEGVQSANSTALADGDSYYFHIRSVDNMGNWQSTVHVGPFFIETVPPTDPTGVSSPSHTESIWSSDNTVDMSWTDATDATSGLDGYSVLWDTNASTIPNQTKDIEEGVQSANSTALADGNSNYFHIRSVDNAGNWQSTVHVGPFFIDANPPADPTSVNSTSHTVSTWSSDNTVDIGWIDAIDSGRGLDGYSVLWDTSAATLPDQTKDIEESVQSVSSTELADGDSHYFHITSVDNSGHWQSTVHVGPFYIAVNCPALSDGTVNPASGKTSASFTYSVNYTDFENDAPDSIKISINGGASVNMTARAGQDNEFTNGEIYEYIISGGTLGAGSHTFQFFANDGTDDAIGDIDVNNGPTVSKAAAAGGGGGGGGGAPPPGVTKVIDVMSSKGEFKENVTCKSEDECVELYIPENTIAKRITGGPIYTIKIIKSEDPPPAPEQTNLIGLVYDFSPEGITFDPAVDLTIKYDESLMAEGVNENSLIIAIWDSDAGKWVELEGTVDPENNTVTTKISHFTEYTILVHTTPASFTVTNLSITPKEVDLGESASVSVTVTNTGDLSGEYELYLKTDDVISQTKEITLTGGSSQQVTFEVTKDVAGECCVDINGLAGSFVINEEAPVVEEEIEPTPKPAAIPVPETIPTSQPSFNWGLLVGILAGVAAIGSVTYYVVRKRVKAKGSG